MDLKWTENAQKLTQNVDLMVKMTDGVDTLNLTRKMIHFRPISHANFHIMVKLMRRNTSHALTNSHGNFSFCLIYSEPFASYKKRTDIWLLWIFFADENKLKLTGNCLLSFALVRERTFQVGPSQHTIQYMKKSEGSYWIKVEKKPFKKTSNESQLAFDKNFSLPELMVSIKRSISKRLHSEKIVFACLENLSDYLGLVHRACNIQWIWSNWNRFSSSFLVVPLGPQ